MSTGVRFTYAQYQEMIRLGVFDPPQEHRVELIYGEIVPIYKDDPMSPINPPHDYALDRLNGWSFEVTPSRLFWVRVQGSIGIAAFESQPQSDMVWLARKDDCSKRRTPEDVILLKERGEKARLYAEAGIRDSWIVNLKDRTIEVRRDPIGSKYR